MVVFADYEAGTRVDFRSGGAPTALTLATSNVLAFELASGSRVIARPSGTEPKAKFYFDVRAEVAPGEAVAVATDRAASTMRKLSEAFVSIAGA